MYTTSPEEIEKQKKEFYDKHRNSNLHATYEYTAEEMESLRKKMYFLINVQNGQDIDDSLTNEGVTLNRFAGDKIKDKDLLILGTGTGREVKLARSLGARRVEGTTLGLRNMKFAEEVVGENLTLCDIHMLPFSAGEFDIVAGYQVFEHSCMPIVAFLECNRVLRIGGTIIVETPPSKGYTYDTWLHHIICYTPRQLYCLLQKAGFTPTVFNGVDISGVDPKSPEFDDIDSAEVMVYMEAVKQNPATYDRGDIARYYEVLNGHSFRF